MQQSWDRKQKLSVRPVGAARSFFEEPLEWDSPGLADYVVKTRSRHSRVPCPFGFRIPTFRMNRTLLTINVRCFDGGWTLIHYCGAILGAPKTAVAGVASDDHVERAQRFPSEMVANDSPQYV